MLEVQIKALNESIQANTAMLEKVLVALTATNTKPQVKAATHASLSEKVEEVSKPDVKAKATKAKPVTKSEPETAGVVTAADLKALAKEAIADGVLRTAIKKLITDAGAETISALDDDQRAEVFTSLTKLRGK